VFLRPSHNCPALRRVFQEPSHKCQAWRRVFQEPSHKCQAQRRVFQERNLLIPLLHRRRWPLQRIPLKVYLQKPKGRYPSG
jgi:hypothetical protein